MNFLSHFYFDRHTADSHLVLGTVLPDLVKNANKNWSLHPAKYQEVLRQRPAQLSICQGWQRHLVVDKYFHSADFFQHHTKKLKEIIRPILADTKVWASFLAHISLELLLDNLLITEKLIDVDAFYKHLEKTDREEITFFLKINQIEQPESFFGYFDHFVESRYLNSYRDEEQVVYALNRISMRLWPDGLAATDRKALSDAISLYRMELKKDFRQIFDEIEVHLHTNR
jgi:hypothetical protein